MMAGLHVQLDVEYANDPKMIDAGPLAELLYVRALCFAKRTMRDGCITRSQLPAISLGIPSAAKHAAHLVDVGAWETTPDGWRITAWLKRNKSARRIAEDSATKKFKSLMGNHERWHVKAERFDPTCELCNPPNDPYGDAHKHPAPDSTESESESEEEEESESESESSRGSHLSVLHSQNGDDDDFRCTIELIVDAKVRERHPHNPKAYRAKTHSNTIDEDGELVRRMLADGSTPEIAALFVLGHSEVAQADTTVPWCSPSCETCNGDAWVDTGDGFAPCPERTVQPA